MLLRLKGNDDIGLRKSIVETFSTSTSLSDIIPIVWQTSVEKTNFSASFYFE